MPEGRFITAKYAGRCPFDGWEWEEGDRIWYVPGEGAYCEGYGRAEEDRKRELARQAREKAKGGRHA